MKFYTKEEQKKIAEKVVEEANEKFKGKIVTKISRESNYCKAEDYHQKYLKKKVCSVNLVTTDWLESNLDKVKYLMPVGICLPQNGMQKKNTKENILRCHVLEC